MKYKVCPFCGDHLDHGEHCDCQDRKREAAPTKQEWPQDKLSVAILSPTQAKVKHFEMIEGGVTPDE